MNVIAKGIKILEQDLCMYASLLLLTEWNLFYFKNPTTDLGEIFCVASVWPTAEIIPHIMGVRIFALTYRMKPTLLKNFSSDLCEICCVVSAWCMEEIINFWCWSKKGLGFCSRISDSAPGRWQRSESLLSAVFFFVFSMPNYDCLWKKWILINV